MAKQTLNNEESGSVIRGKINDNFTEVYSGTIAFTNGLRIGAMSGTFANSGLYLGSGAGITSNFTTSRGGNIGIGTSALSSLTDGAAVFNSSFNTAIGYETLTQLTTSYDAVAIGARSQKYVTGPRNTAIGSLTMSSSSATSAFDNCVFGYSAGQMLTTGYENCFFGSSAGQATTTGYRNTTMGLFAGSKISTGYHNTLIGSEAGERIDTQNQNTIIGFYAGVYNKGSNNAFFGAYAGGATLGLPPAGTGYNMNGNTFIGTQAGTTETAANESVTGTNYSTFLGYQSGGGSSTQVEYSTALGYRAKVYSSRSMVFGSEVDADRVNYGFGGESYGSGQGVCFIKNAVTDASAAPTSGIILHSRDSSDGDGTLALFLEQDVEVVGTFTASHKVKVWINGTEYWLQLDAV